MPIDGTQAKVGQRFVRVWPDGSVDGRQYLASLDGTVVYRRLAPTWRPEPDPRFRQVRVEMWDRYVASASFVTHKKLLRLWGLEKKAMKDRRKELADAKR